jgi:benzylsuccinate CoA-transferase BbsF subunit
VAITVTADNQWPALADAIGRADLGQDPSLATAAGRKARESEIDAAIEAWTSTLAPEAAQETLINLGVPAHLVAESRDSVADPQLEARGHFVAASHGELGDVTVEGSRFQLSRTPAVIERGGPTYGQDNEYVLRELLGLSEEEVIELVAAGALE